MHWISVDSPSSRRHCRLQPHAQVVGIGTSILEAAKAARIELPSHKGRHVNCIAVSTVCSGTPPSWRATSTQSGMVVLPAIESSTAVQKGVEATASVLHANDLKWPHRGDLLVLSIHWGPNWAYREHDDTQEQTFRREYAHRVIDELGVDLVYGHSSHHIRGMELYRGKLIVYGAGDLVNDYEVYNTLGALFFVDVNGGTLSQLCLVPTFMNRLSLQRVKKQSYERWDPIRSRTVEYPNGVTEFSTSSHDGMSDMIVPILKLARVGMKELPWSSMLRTNGPAFRAAQFWCTPPRNDLTYQVKLRELQLT
ncbi:hypothetical protein PI124_g15323 [Phytophthora idaei]|nr:hypothetical protein PI125_g18323 [Phytophthora idaei]KAG3144018.1 hypothetical protein PI126_g14354 [Phytophthora idaei]KAG3239751.1 hypothetical protein PI124_g15323 [Phytophthora idaei]